MVLDLLKKDFVESSYGMAAKQPRVSMTVTLYPEARKVFDRISNARGMNKTKMAERIMLWFAAQSPDLQNEILYPREAKPHPVGKPFTEEGVKGVSAPALEANPDSPPPPAPPRKKGNDSAKRH